MFEGGEVAGLCVRGSSGLGEVNDGELGVAKRQVRETGIQVEAPRVVCGEVTRGPTKGAGGRWVISVVKRADPAAQGALASQLAG